MKLRKYDRKERCPSAKITLSEIASNFLIVFIVFGAVELIKNSLRYEGWLQNLLLSLGTGAAMSALVSLVFYFNDKLIKKRERLHNRITFMKDFKNLYYHIIRIINFDSETDSTLDLETYVKKQHRWFHEYYKRIYAKSGTDAETQQRIQQLNNFITHIATDISNCFEYNHTWKNGEYSEWQYSELQHFYIGLKNIELYLNQNDYSSAFLEFAEFLERVKRISSEFIELENFQLLSFRYDEKTNLKIDQSRFEEKEPFFKFAREFNDIRSNNYKKYYSENKLNSN